VLHIRDTERCDIVEPLFTIRVQNYADSRIKSVCCRKLLLRLTSELSAIFVQHAVDRISTDTEHRDVQMKTS